MQMVDKKYNKTMEDNFSDSDSETNGSSRYSKGRSQNPARAIRPRQYGNSRKPIKKITEERRSEYLKRSEFHFKRSIKLNSELVMAYNNYGCLLRRLERFEEAQTMFEHALRIDPKFQMAERNLDRCKEKMRIKENGGVLTDDMGGKRKILKERERPPSRNPNAPRGKVGGSASINNSNKKPTPRSAGDKKTGSGECLIM